MVSVRIYAQILGNIGSIAYTFLPDAVHLTDTKTVDEKIWYVNSHNGTKNQFSKIEVDDGSMLRKAGFVSFSKSTLNITRVYKDKINYVEVDD